MFVTDIDAVLAAMKRIAGLKSDTELARVLRVSRNTISTWRKRGAIPEIRLGSFAEEYDVNLATILGGSDYRSAVVAEHWEVSCALCIINLLNEQIVISDKYRTYLWWAKHFNSFVIYFQDEIQRRMNTDGDKNKSEIAMSIMKELESVDQDKLTQLAHNIGAL